MTTYIRAKRDTFTTCPVCGDVFRQDGIGRMRTYCSDACKMKAHRRKATGKLQRKELNTVRTDYLEQQIALYEAMKRYDAVDAMRAVAREVSAPISEERIAELRTMFGAEVTRWQL